MIAVLAFCLPWMAVGHWGLGGDLQGAMLGVLFDGSLRQGVDEIMASIFGWRQHLGLDHPPIPQAGPVIPPTQLRGTGHDSVGTSCTHPGDTDDDHEESSEDEEGEYDRNELVVWVVF
ncbi:unnamed protein product [Lactuca saligna]|uniref:Secreted protein n=1 Tax=Lactuca saligna TaxID=75948 RepID=A0AA35YBY7_LACSI|nr:unnamed protein product [Lactuca saligna]